MECNTGKVINVGGLYTRFQGLVDKRKPKGKHYALATILLGMFLAKLCREDKPSGIAEWVALRIALHSPARYIGMIGNRAKCKTILDYLKADGFPADSLQRVYAPIGLNLGGL